MTSELDPVVAACGCVNHFSGQVSHCPLHRAAPDLLALAERVAEHFAGTDAPLGDAARAAIRQAKGAS